MQDEAMRPCPPRAIVCSFAGGIGRMKAFDQRDPLKVLQVLAADPKFSVFDATERKSIARSLTVLKQRGLIDYPEPQPGFPWSKARVTEAGLALLNQRTEREG